MDSKKVAALKMRTPKWARLDEEAEKEKEKKNVAELSEEDEDDALSALRKMTRTTGKYIDAARKAKILSPEDSTAKILKDITIGHQSNGSVNCVKFHPSRPVMVTGTENGTVSLFEICESNEKLNVKKCDHFLQDAKFKKSKIDSVHFFNEGLSLLVVPANKKYCYSYDLLEGKVSQVSVPESVFHTYLRIAKTTLSSDGTYAAYLVGYTDVYVFIFDTMEHLHTFRADSNIVEFFFSVTNRNIIYAFSENGTVFMWDLAQKLHHLSFLDAGCVQGTCLALSPNDQFIACGSNTGIVNVYEASKAFDMSGTTVKATEAKPLYTSGNLTTSVSFVKFNHDSKLLTFGSDVKRMAIRLMHCESGTIYQNFPSRPEMFSKDSLKCAAFSPNSGFLAYGSASGVCRFYRLNYFKRY